MLLSIIIPTLNEEKNLSVLLNSIKKQNFKNYEIIVADAGSQDKTREIAKSYNCRLAAGGLPAKGRNEGAKAAQGELLLFLDADVILPPNFLDNFLEKFKEKKLDIASCFIFPKGNLLDKIAFSGYNIWSKITQKILPHAAIVILAKKDVHKKILGFDEEIKLAEDHAYARSAKKLVKAKIGFFNMGPVLTSVRRFRKDGRMKTCLKYAAAELYMVLFGPIKSNIFEYKFDHYAKRKKI